MPVDFSLLKPLQADKSNIINLPSSSGNSLGDDIGSILSGIGSLVGTHQDSLMGINQGIGNPTQKASQTAITDPSSLNGQNRLDQLVNKAMPAPKELLSSPAYQTSLAAYQNAQQHGIAKSPYLTVVDFSQPATSKRLWVVDPRNGSVLLNTQVAQGKEGFSNTPGSHQSSLGTFVTGASYEGHNGRSLRIQGLDKGINDNAASRDIVVHGSQYADKGGRSFGCFAVPTKDAQKLIDLTQGGSVIHAYAPGQPGSDPRQPNFITNPDLGKQVLANPNNNPFRPQQGSSMSTVSAATPLIKHFEGFSDKPYWDVNAYRVGYGSDTITKPDGTVVKVQPGMSISQADAERDLQRRIPEFERRGIKDVGESNWNRLPEPAKAALTSVIYNYGSLSKLSGVKDAVKSGDLNKISDEVRKLGTHNNGVNKSRREWEAEIIKSSVGPQASNNTQIHHRGIGSDSNQGEEYYKQKTYIPEPTPDNNLPNNMVADNNIINGLSQFNQSI